MSGSRLAPHVLRVGERTIVLRPSSHRAEASVTLAIALCGVSAVLFVLGILFFVAREAWPFLRGRFNAEEFFGSVAWMPDSARRPRYGAVALFAGTGAVTAVAVIAVPMGLGAAVFMSEYCPPRPREALKVVIELLSAIPSVVWGFIALTLMNPLIIWRFKVPVGLNAANAGVILGMLSVPVIASIGEDAIRAVPDSYREAAEALGATRLEIIVRVLLPSARGGLLAAVLLGLGRVIGETMTVLMAAGHAVQIPRSIFDSVRTLTATIAAELGESPSGGEHYRALFTLGLVLFVITFAVNLTADLLVRGREPGRGR